MRLLLVLLLALQPVFASAQALKTPFMGTRPAGDTAAGAGAMGATTEYVERTKLGQTLKELGATGLGVADDGAAFVAGSGPAIVSAGTYKVGTNRAVYRDLMVAFGATINVSAGATLTVYGDVVAPPNQQIFTGAGTVILAGQKSPVFGEWWGAKGDNSTDSAPAFQKAVNALVNGGRVHFLTGNYKLGCASADAITVTNNNVSLHGVGALATLLRPMTNCPRSLINIATTGRNGNVTDLAFYGDQVPSVPYTFDSGSGPPFGPYANWTAITCTGCNTSEISRIVVIYARVALNAPHYMVGALRDWYVQGCYQCAIFGGGTLNANGAQVMSEINLSDWVINGSGGSGSAGIILDSGIAEFKSFNVLQAGTSYRVGGKATDYGILIQNSSTGGHTPEAVRIYANNIDANRLANVAVTGAIQVEFHGSLLGLTEGGPALLLNAIGGRNKVEGFSFNDGWIRAGWQDGVLIQAACNVSFKNNIALVGNGYAAQNTYAGIRAASTACGTLEVVGNMMGGEIYANATNVQANALAISSGALADYTDPGTGQIYKGRLLVTGNMMQGNMGTAIIGDSTVDATRKLISNNLQ